MTHSSSSIPRLVIVSGPPGAGKTTLGRRLAYDLRLPFMNKDDIKETLFDALGSADREASIVLGRASFEVLYVFIKAQIAAGQSLLAEANFHSETSAGTFTQLQQRHPFYPVQIVCTAPAEVLLRRFERRATSTDRHPGHHDALRARDVEAQIAAGIYGPMKIGGKVIEVDTTDFDSFDYDRLVREIRG